MSSTKDLVLPTALVGSIPRPSWYTRSLHGQDFKMALSDRGFREQYIDAVGAYVNDQECAGLDIIVDGDARFDDDVGGRGWFFYMIDRLGGFSERTDHQDNWAEMTRPGRILWELMEAYQAPVLTEKVSLRAPLQYAAIWQVTQKLTDRPVKFGAIAVDSVFHMIQNRHYDSNVEFLNDLADIVNSEYRQLGAVGCPIIQIEEPMLHLLDVPSAGDLDKEALIEVFNRQVEGVDCEIWCHTCWGNPAQQSVKDETTTYEPALEDLFRVNADVVTFECASTGGKDIPAIGAFKTDKKIAIGVISHLKTQVETPDEVAALIRKALEYIPAERLIATTDCGFGREGLSRRIAFYKMVALVEGTNIVRKELGLPEAEVRASDPRFAFSYEG